MTWKWIPKKTSENSYSAFGKRERLKADHYLADALDSKQVADKRWEMAFEDLKQGKCTLARLAFAMEQCNVMDKKYYSLLPIDVPDKHSKEETDG